MTVRSLTFEQLDRFWAKVPERRPADGCWEWLGARMGGTHNYGQLRIQGKLLYAHRTSFELHHGPVPTGLRVLHRCDNPPCVNPAHLFAGTAMANSRDMAQKGRSRNRAFPGSQNGHAKLNEDEVRLIRDRFAAGERQTALASEYGVSQALISLIVKREAWKHVGGGNRA